MSASAAQVLPPSAGWAVVVALGFGFAVFMLGLTAIQERYTRMSVKSNDEFTSASRSVKTGLIAAGIVSAWTWAATLLQSSTVAFKLGVSGPYWYAGGATVQVLVFAMISSKTKINAPGAHTYLQIIRERWGTGAHLCFLVFAFATNILVGSMLILGSSATVHQLTGMPTLAAIFLTPVSVACYAILGGMRATLLADWTHTAVMISIILMFAITVYSVSDKIGSASAMYDLLATAAPVAGNADGSYLTLRSLDGLRFGVINVAGNFAAVFADQSYHQRGIASNPATATRAFILGGLAWFAVPMVTASSLGLAARALYGRDPSMATLSPDEVSAGLAAPAAAAALLGRGGAAAMLIMLYLAVTSATSAQLIAVSSIVTFDIWQPYVQPGASEKRLFWVSHVAVGAWSIALGVLGVIFYKIGISMGWLYLFMGIAICPAVFPIFSCIVWRKANRTGALVGMFSGLVLGVMAWLVSAKHLGGALTIETTSLDNPLVAGNVTSLLVPAVITVAWSLWRPENYSFEGTRAINMQHLDTAPLSSSGSRSGSEDKTGTPPSPAHEKHDSGSSTPAALEKATELLNQLDESDVHRHVVAAGLDPVQLQRSFRTAVLVSIPLTFILLIFVPAMAVTVKTFSPAGLGAWVGICIFWLFCSAGIVVLLPLWESRAALAEITHGILCDVMRRPRPSV